MDRPAKAKIVFNNWDQFWDEIEERKSLVDRREIWTNEKVECSPYAFGSRYFIEVTALVDGYICYWKGLDKELFPTTAFHNEDYNLVQQIIDRASSLDLIVKHGLLEAVFKR